MLNILNYVSQNILVLSNNTHASSKDAWWETSALTTHWKSDCFATRAVSLYMKAVREMMIPVRNDTQAACIQDDPWKKKTDSYLNTDFKMQERARASFQCRQKKKKKKKPRWKSQSRNEFSWEYGNVMKMSAVAWIHSMDGEIICVEAKKKKENEKNIHGSWWRWRSWLKEIEESHWTNNSPSVSGEDP